ncbi:DUF2157 domain-containing protein [Chengkuizengella sp. SCS-71B]|uniref:DUF2157 domain-containing protein n=1 Tax=Chengkuizengella sp. SCS-71B TaxID=3115290 RepID=UPI0032C246F7
MRKLLQKEGLGWVEKQIISNEQFNQILELYPEQDKRSYKIIPILASLLIGLGILTFIASNWSLISNPIKLLIILIVMLGFYGFGEQKVAKGSLVMGHCFISLGVVAFGAGIILTGQMFHISANDVTSFIVWGLAGLAMTYIYRSSLLFYLTLVILNLSQGISLITYNQFSFVTFIFLAIGLGLFAFKYRHHIVIILLLSTSVFIHSLFLFSNYDISWFWMLVPVYLFYVLADIFPKDFFFSIYRKLSLLFFFMFALFMVLYRSSESFSAFHFITFLLIALISIAFKWKNNRLFTGYEWVIMIPVFYLIPFTDVVYIFMMYFFSMYLLWLGFKLRNRMIVNLGSFSFLFSTLVAYLNLTWDFMPKSISFILGGGLLFGIYFILQKQKEKWLIDGGGD